MKLCRLSSLFLTIMISGCALIGKDDTSELATECQNFCTSELKECNAKRGNTKISDNAISAVQLLTHALLSGADSCKKLYEKEQQCLNICLGRDRNTKDTTG